jgi:hypothetical protein
MMYKMAIQVLLEQTENEEVLMVPGRSCREDVFWAGWSAFGSLLVNVYLFFLENWPVPGPGSYVCSVPLV